MNEETFEIMANVADAAASAAPEGPVHDALRLIGITLDAASALLRAGSSDPVEQIERILGDDLLVARARAKRDNELAAKFARED